MLQFSDIAYMDDVGIHVLFSNNVRELFSPNMSKPSNKKSSTTSDLYPQDDLAVNRTVKPRE